MSESLRFKESVHALTSTKNQRKPTEITDKTRRLHDRLIQTYLSGLGSPQGVRFLKLPEEILLTIRYIRDAVRTITMMRALKRLVDVKMEQKKGPIHVVEAGCGTGLFAAVAAALDEEIHVTAIDRSPNQILVAQKLIDAVGLSDQVTLERRDLARSPYTEPADIVIAEHLSRGLLQEDATRLPRAVTRADPKFFLPYSARPTLVNGIIFLGAVLPHTDKKDGAQRYGVMLDTPKDLRQVELRYGEEIVLGDPKASDTFDAEGDITLQPEVNFVMVANDIRWVSPEFDGENLFLETFEDILRRREPMDKMNHLMGPALLSRGGDLRSLHCLYNSSQRPAVSRIRVRYPAGLELRNEDPEISSSNSEVEVGTADAD